MYGVVRRRASGVIAGLLFTAGLVVVAGNFAVAAPPVPPPFSAYATGTAVHADLLRAADNLANGLVPTGNGGVIHAELGFSGATVDSQGLSTQQVNEMGVEVQPPLPDTTDAVPAGSLDGDKSYGRGSGLEAKIFSTIIGNPGSGTGTGVRQSAPPSASPSFSRLHVSYPLDNVSVHPLWADLLHGDAQVNWDPSNFCNDNPYSRGVGYVADAQVLQAGNIDPTTGRADQATLAVEAPGPTRAVSQSSSTTSLVDNGDGTSGLTSEVRGTIAPVTLFEGMPNQITIEVLGEWVLKTAATGKAGGATVTFGPAYAADTDPILRIFGPGVSGGPIQLTFADLKLPQTHLGSQGLLYISLGEQPRPIGSDTDSPPPAVVPSPDGTSVAAAADVVRVQVLANNAVIPGGPPPSDVADVRIGHMESRVNVPAGGIPCGAAPVPTTAGPTTTTTAGPTTTTTAGPTTTTTQGPTTTTTQGPTTTTTQGPTTTTSTTVPGTTTTTAPGATTTTSTSTSTTVAPTTTTSPPTTSPPTTSPPTTSPPTTSPPTTAAPGPTTTVQPFFSPGNANTNPTVLGNRVQAPAASVLANTFTRPETPVASAVRANPNFTG